MKKLSVALRLIRLSINNHGIDDSSCCSVLLSGGGEEHYTSDMKWEHGAEVRGR